MYTKKGGKHNKLKFFHRKFTSQIILHINKTNIYIKHTFLNCKYFFFNSKYVLFINYYLFTLSFNK